MMKRTRLSRPFCFTLLAIAGLLALSYFPLARIRAASAATILPSARAGQPLVNLKTTRSLKLTYTGPADAVAALQAGTASPTALAAADFDADGAMDVVAGYSTKNGGVLALFRGNPDAFAPKDPSLYQKAMQGSIASTFLPKAATFTLPASPDLIVTGDFNRDGNKDVLAATRGGALYFLAGDGKGNFLAPEIVALADQVTALAAMGDGHVAVSTDGRSGPQLTIMAPGVAGLTAGQTYSLPARGASVAWGTLGGGADVAVGAGAKVMIIYGALGANPQTETIHLPFYVRALTLGDFIWDRDGRTEISVLAKDGTIHILQHGTLDTRALTPSDIPGRRAAVMAKAKKPLDPISLGAWTVAKHLSYARSVSSGEVSSSAFSSPRLASSSTHDLMVIDSGRSQLNILDTSGKTASPSADISFSSTPVAALALPQKINAGRDIVVLTAGQATPLIINFIPGLTFNVNTTADIDSINACTNTSVTTTPATLSLREAVCLANNNAPATSTINLPSGTYSLTSLETGELQLNPNGIGYSLSIAGSGSSTTIIQQTDGVDRIFEQDFVLSGNNPFSISNVTLSSGNCINTATDDCGFGGGAVLGTGSTGDDLTITNVVFNQNKVNATANGGAISAGTIGNVTITFSTFSSNTATGGTGGGLDFNVGAGGSGNLSITNSSFTGNTSTAGSAPGQGGGLLVTLSPGSTATISGSTFTGNQATGSGSIGGAISANLGTTVSNSRIVGNSASVGSGFAETGGTGNTGVAINNWWGCNAGPGGSGCDTTGTVGAGSAVTFSPFLVLSISASPTSINPSGTSTLTADLTHNSASTGGFSVPSGTPVTFGGTLDSSVSPNSTTLASGTATSTYTAGATPGAGTGTASVDNQQVSANINILNAVTVTTSPSGLAITVDGVPSTAPQTFNWIVGSSHTIATSSPQAGPPGSQYVFDNWSDLGAISHGVTAPSSPTTYTATFDTQYQLTTQASPPADGSVTPTSGQYFASGATIPVTATANAGFGFNNWTSTGGTFDSTTSASTNFHMPSAAATVTGNFVPVNVGSPTTTSVSSNNNPSFTSPPGNSVTFTSTVTSSTTVNEGTVTFSDPANDFICSGGNTVPVSSGQAACTTSFSTEGSRDVTATYNGTVNFQGSHGVISQTVNNHTVVAGTIFCNPGAITVPGTAGAAAPYPSNIFVTGLGNVGSVTVKLNGISSSNITATDLLLVGPTGAKIIPFASVGDGSTINGVTITLDDSASGLIPGGSPLTSGTFKPTSLTGGTSLVFPAPAPSTSGADYATTDGTSTLASKFNGTAANGTWQLFAMANASSAAASISGGWCVNISPATVQTTITTSPAGLLVSADGGTPTAAPLVENWVPGSSHTIATSSPQAGAPGVQYVFSSWTDGGAISHSITVPSIATTYTASFNTQYQLTVNATPPAGGNVVPASPTFFNAGSSPSISATANAGYTFTNWSSSPGSVTSPTSASTTITMNAPESATANFVAAQPPAITSANNTMFQLDVLNSFTVTTTGSPTPSITRSGALPNGVTFTDNGNGMGTLGGTPTVSGTFHLVFTASNGVGTHAVQNFTLTVSGPLATLTPASNDFGQQYLNKTKSKTFTLKNTGSGTLNIASVTLTPGAGTSAGDFTFTKSCGATLAKAGSCQIIVTSNATEAGSLSATLTVTDDAPGSPQQSTVTASVINPKAALSLSSLYFGKIKIGNSSTLSTVLSNPGTSTLNISNIGLSGTDPGDYLVGGTCTSTLGAGGSCTITVTFTPTATGSRPAKLVISDNAGSSTGKQTVTLSGMGSN